MEKIFANGATHKRLISQICEQLMQAQYKKKKKTKVFSFYLLFGNWNLLKWFRAPPRSLKSRYCLGLQATEVLMNRESLSSSLTGVLVGFASTQDIIQRIPEIPCYMGPWRSRAQHGSWVLSTKREREKQ